MRRLIGCVTLAWLVVSVAAANTLEVGIGKPYILIQDAIDDAVDGDEVIVFGGGTWAERLHFGGKNITVRSRYLEEPGVNEVVIDASEGGPVVTLSGTARLSGFTLRRGRADYGSGVNVTGGAPEISHNIICDGKSTGSTRGAIYTVTGGWIHHNTIQSNVAWTGAGIMCGGGALVEHNIIEENSATGTGGGIRTTTTNGVPTVRYNTVRNNTAADAGGMYIYFAAPTYGNLICGNTATGAGGGIFAKGTGTMLHANTVYGNVASSGGGVYVDSYNTTVTLTNMIVCGNSPYGISQMVQDTPGTVVCSHCDVYGNASGNYQAPLVDATGSNGNISADPLFAGAALGDFHLRSVSGRWSDLLAAWVIDSVSSPCIDAGAPGSDYANEPAPNGGRVNMGAYGNTAEASKTPNRAPSAPATVQITPGAPVRTAHDLTAEATGSVDADGDTIEYLFIWSKSTNGGASWTTVLSGPVVPASMTAKGERWKVRARATDGLATSSQTSSGTVLIQNTAPTVPHTLTYSRTTPGDGDSSVPTASGSTDADGDNVTYRYEWCKSPDGISWGDWTNIGNALSGGDTLIGERWKVRAKAYDGAASSGWLEGAVIAVCSMTNTVTPAGATIPRASELGVLFRWPVSQASAESRVGLYRLQMGPAQRLVETPVAGTLRWATADRRLMFKPSEPLAANADYLLRLASGISRRAGGAMNWTEGFSFRTGAEPAVISYAPAGSGINVDLFILVGFDQDMQQEATRNAFSITPHINGNFSWPNARTLRFTPADSMQAGTEYQVRVAASARGTNNRTIRKDFLWSFTTAGVAPTLVANASSALTGSGTSQIVVNLSAAAQVQVEIMNLAGRTVAQLPAQDCAAGLSSLLWNGRGSSGTAVPAGRYLAKVTAVSGGAQARCLTPLQR